MWGGLEGGKDALDCHCEGLEGEFELKGGSIYLRIASKQVGERFHTCEEVWTVLYTKISLPTSLRVSNDNDDAEFSNSH